MPIDALPVPWADQPALPVRVPYRRTYRDLLGRPMSGKVRITRTSRVVEDTVVIPPATVEVALVDGGLTVDLPPGQYQLIAQLTTVDGSLSVDRDDITL